MVHSYVCPVFFYHPLSSVSVCFSVGLFEFGYIPSSFSLEKVLRTQMEKMVVFGVSLALSQ